MPLDTLLEGVYGVDSLSARSSAYMLAIDGCRYMVWCWV
jgi:hypothetical protein